MQERELCKYPNITIDLEDVSHTCQALYVMKLLFEVGYICMRRNYLSLIQLTPPTRKAPPLIPIKLLLTV